LVIECDIRLIADFCFDTLNSIVYLEARVVIVRTSTSVDYLNALFRYVNCKWMLDIVLLCSSVYCGKEFMCEFTSRIVANR